MFFFSLFSGSPRDRVAASGKRKEWDPPSLLRLVSFVRLRACSVPLPVGRPFVFRDGTRRVGRAFASSMALRSRESSAYSWTPFHVLPPRVPVLRTPRRGPEGGKDRRKRERGFRRSPLRNATPSSIGKKKDGSTLGSAKRSPDALRPPGPFRRFVYGGGIKGAFAVVIPSRGPNE